MSEIFFRYNHETQECILKQYRFHFAASQNLAGKVLMRGSSDSPGLFVSTQLNDRPGTFCMAIGGAVFIPQTWSELIKIKSVFGNDYIGISFFFSFSLIILTFSKAVVNSSKQNQYLKMIVRTVYHVNNCPETKKQCYNLLGMLKRF